MPIPPYPPEVREKARELFSSNPNLSYSQLAEKLKLEFPDIFPEKPPSKSTVMKWIKDLRDKKFEEVKVENLGRDKPVPTESKIKVSESTPDLYRTLPEITPQEIAEKLAEKSTVVEEDLSKEEEEYEEALEEITEEEPIQTEETSTPFKIKPRYLYILLAATVVGIIIIYIMKRHSAKKEEPKPTAYLPETITKDEETEKKSNAIEL